MLRVVSFAILIVLTIAVVGSIAVATLSVFFWTADAAAALPALAAFIAAPGLAVRRLRLTWDDAWSRRTLLALGLVAAFAGGGFLAGHLSGQFSAPNEAPMPSASAIVEASATSWAPLALTPPEVQPPAPVPEPAQPVVASAPPASTPPLTSEEVLEAQAWLKAFGFDPGPLDGQRGPQTAAAVKRYQAARQKEETGLLDRRLLRQVRQEAGQSGR